MTPALRSMLALWAGGLAAVVCLCFLPGSRRAGVFTLLMLWGLMAAAWFAARHRAHPDEAICLADLPDNAYRQPIVLVCGDVPQAWPEDSTVLTVAQGCWIRVPEQQDVALFARRLLWQRPGWGRQLSVMVTVCPQKHRNTDTLTSTLLALRWQIGQLRRESGHRIPLVLHGLVGSAIINETLWQAAIPGEPVSVWRRSSAPCSIAAWVTTGGAMAVQQQVFMNTLMSWFHQHVSAVFVDENLDIPVTRPTALLWGLCPHIDNALPVSPWISWLQRHTALTQVRGWLPGEADRDNTHSLPDFILPLLPEGQGMTPRQRAGRLALSLLTLAAVAALCSSAWNNHQLLQRIAFDIHHDDRIPRDNVVPKARAVAVLRQDAAQLDGWARNGEPLRLGLGLYQGARLHMPVLAALRSSTVPFTPSPTPAPQKSESAPTTVRLDSMSLFAPGKSTLKAGSTNILINALVGIKARPGWLIVVSGYTDNTGSQRLNQTLSQKRAESVRNWMRDTGDVPERCFAVQGYGAGRPVATNDTPEGRALNRRVEIRLVPQADACQVPGTTSASSQDDGVTDNEMEK